MEYKLDITRFDGGISEDPREPTPAGGSLVKHFNIWDNPFKLTPYRSTEADTSTSVSSTDLKQYDPRHFQLGLDGILYALGKNADGQPKVVSKSSPTASGNWTLEATAEGNAARILGCFIEWQSAWYFFEGTTKLAKWTIGSTVDDAVLTTATITTVAQGVVGSDGNLYLFYNNKVVKVNSSGTATDNVLTAIPSDMRIVSATRWGNYIMIGCVHGTSATAIPSGRSIMIQWDMVTSSTVNDVIDLGEGELKCLGTVEGRVVAVSNKYMDNAFGQTRGSMVVRLWGGGAAEVVKEIIANQTVLTTTQNRFLNEVVIKNNKMYWVASVPFGASTATETTHHIGIWAFGRKNSGANFALTLDFVEEGLASANYFIRSFGAAGEYWFINHSADGSVTKTNDAATFTFTSIYETQIWRPGGSRKKKKLVGVTVDTESLASGESVVVKYKKDAETSFTTILTHDTDDALFKSAINIESSGAALPEFREIILRVESQGGAEVVGIYAKAELRESDFYE